MFKEIMSNSQRTGCHSSFTAIDEQPKTKYFSQSYDIIFELPTQTSIKLNWLAAFDEKFWSAREYSSTAVRLNEATLSDYGET